MKSFKKETYDTPEETVLKQVENNGEILFKFEVVPYDSKIKDRRSPTIFVTNSRLLFYYDEHIDVYELSELHFDFSGTPPKFKLWEILIQPIYNYSNEDDESYLKLVKDEQKFRFSFNEMKKPSIDIVLREDSRIKKSYQTWAMGRILMNIKNGIPNSPDLIEMFRGDFSSFNQRAVLIFAIISTVYFLIRWLALPYAPDLLQSLFDGIYVVLLLLMGIWLYLSFEKNLKRYQYVYRSYQINDQDTKKNDVTNQNN